MMGFFIAAVGTIRNGNPKFSLDDIAEKWGFLPTNSLCNPRATFRLMLRSLNLKPGEDIVARLRQAGVPVLYSNKADFDGDKLADWLVVVDTPASERAAEAWIFVDSGEEYLAIPVFDYAPQYPGFAIGVSNNPIKVDTFPFSGVSQPAIVLQVGTQVTIFTVHHKELAGEVELLQEINDVKSFKIGPEADELTVAYLPGAYDAFYDIYVWREGLGRFLKVSQIERLLFEQDNPVKAIRAIQTELSYLNPKTHDYPTDAARLYYMLGLAYELQDNPSAAVDTYLKVWREFPGNPHAVLAREKIKLSN